MGSDQSRQLVRAVVSCSVPEPAMDPLEMSVPKPARCANTSGLLFFLIILYTTK